MLLYNTMTLQYYMRMTKRMMAYMDAMSRYIQWVCLAFSVYNKVFPKNLLLFYFNFILFFLIAMYFFFSTLCLLFFCLPSFRFCLYFSFFVSFFLPLASLSLPPSLSPSLSLFNFILDFQTVQ